MLRDETTRAKQESVGEVGEVGFRAGAEWAECGGVLPRCTHKGGFERLMDTIGMNRAIVVNRATIAHRAELLLHPALRKWPGASPGFHPSPYQPVPSHPFRAGTKNTIGGKLLP